MRRIRFTPLVLALLIGTFPAVAADRGAGEFMVLLETEENLAEAGSREPHGALVRLDRAVLEKDPAQLAIPLPGGRVLTAFRSGESRRDARGFNWNGELQQEVSAVAPVAPGLVSFYLAGDRLFGTLRTEDGGYFELEPEGKLHRLVRYPVRPGDGCGVGHAAPSDAAAGEMTGKVGILVTGTESECPAPSGSNAILNVLVLYPRSLESSAAAVHAYATSRVQEANTLFTNSNIKITYQLVPAGSQPAVMITGQQPPPPIPTGSSSAPLATGPVLDWLNVQFANDGADTEVEILRAYHGADLVVVVIPEFSSGNNVNCGVANLPRLSGNNELLDDSTEAFDGQAFAVVELNCGNNDYTFAHELGHTFGLRHQDDDGTYTPVYPWAYGHNPCLGSSPVAATVMACLPSGSACNRIPRFSHPDRLYLHSGGWIETGVHTAEAGAACMPRASHNACVANHRRSQYAGFAAPPPGSPPTLDINSPAHGATVTSPATLTATAGDPQDGNRTAFIQWTSDRQGALGTGSPLTVHFTRFGRHLITATVSDTAGTKLAKSIELLVSESAPPQVFIDLPAGGGAAESGANVQVVGWALDDSGVPNPPTFQLDGQAVNLTVTRADRPDVCAAVPNVHDPHCPKVGWVGKLDSRQLTNDTHTLTMTAKDLFNNTSSFSRTFTTQNQSTTFLDPIADAWTSQSHPSTNYGADGKLEMRASGSNDARHAYLKFNLAGVTRPPTSVTLSVYTSPIAWPELHVYRLIDTSWTESGINWNNGPIQPLDYLPLPGQPANAYTPIDLTPLFPGGGGLVTLGLVTTDNPGHYFVSWNGDINKRPKLKVVY